MQDILCLQIPQFKVDYKKSEKYGYTNEKEKSNLKRLLCNTTGGYCMYCYSRIKVDGKFNGNLEHAIEKVNSEKLVECIPNIGIACTYCNQSFKRRGERQRKLLPDKIQAFHSKCRCYKDRRRQCTVPCKALRELQKEYSMMLGAEILLQPMNIRSRKGDILRLQYDVLRMRFEPFTDGSLSTYERNFMNAHINRFHLNDPKYKTVQIRDFVSLVIDTGGKMPVYEYNNLVVKLFAEQLEGKTAEERLNICEKIYPILALVG